MRRAAVAAVGLVALTAPASARAEFVERVRAATPVSTFGSAAAYSRYVPETKRYRLVIWRDDAARIARIPSRGSPFDADLGLGRNGRLVAVYSRCAKYFRPERSFQPIRPYDEGCSLYEYDLNRRRERRLVVPSRPAGSEILPSISGRRLVFARVAPTPPRRTPRLPELISTRLGTGGERRLPRPSGWGSPVVLGDNLGPLTIDVAGDQAVIGWRHNARSWACDAATNTGTATTAEIWLYDLAKDRRRRIAGDCHSTDEFHFEHPGFSGSTLLHAYSTYDPENGDRTWLRAVDLRTRARSAGVLATAGAHLVISAQTGGGWTWFAFNEIFAGYHTTAIHRERIVLTPR